MNKNQMLAEVQEENSVKVVLICICCSKELESVFSESPYQPSGGVICETTGNYGSTQFDPMDPESLLFFICDECLVAKQKHIFHMKENSGKLIPWETVRAMEEEE
jgi:hypothetical protein